MSHTGLTPRQLEILSLKAAGHTRGGIARILGISALTVRSHTTDILRHLGVVNSTAAVVLAIRDGYLDPDKIELLRRSPTDE